MRLVRSLVSLTIHITPLSINTTRHVHTFAHNEWPCQWHMSADPHAALVVYIHCRTSTEKPKNTSPVIIRKLSKSTASSLCHQTKPERTDSLPPRGAPVSVRCLATKSCLRCLFVALVHPVSVSFSPSLYHPVSMRLPIIVTSCGSL